MTINYFVIYNPPTDAETGFVLSSEADGIDVWCKIEPDSSLGTGPMRIEEDDTEFDLMDAVIITKEEAVALAEFSIA